MGKLIMSLNIPPPDPKRPQDSPLYTVFPQVVDIATAFLLTSDYTRRHFPMVAWKRLLTTNAELDEVHGEVPETAKRWSAPFWVRAFVVPEIVSQELTRFGLEEKRDAELYMTTPDLATAGMLALDTATYEISNLAQGIGDHFFYHGVEYEIRQFIPYSRWGNTDRVLYFAASATIYRQVSAGASLL